MAQTPGFKYAPMFQMGSDETEYYLLTKNGVSANQFRGRPVLKVAPETLTMLTQQVFHNVSFMLRRARSEQVAKVLADPRALDNDKYMTLSFLRNAEVAPRDKLPLYQDTNTTIVYGERGQQVWASFCDEGVIPRGAYSTYIQDGLRYSQNAPLNMYDEVGIRCNLPAQISLGATERMEYRLLFITKGGGSANKTYLHQMTRIIIQNPGTLVPFLVKKIKSLGIATCPLYHTTFVIGGTSAEKDLLTMKPASTHYYDDLPISGDETGRAFRDIALEEGLLGEAHKIRLGAQFSGKYMAHNIQVVRLPRHSASCPIGVNVSCSTDRSIRAKVNKEGSWIEKLDEDPGSLIPEELCQAGEGDMVEVSLNQSMTEICRELSQYPISTRISLDGTITATRDVIHVKLKAHLGVGEESFEYLKNHSILYAGPAKTPEGIPYNSIGPTTANCMDPYVNKFQDHGGSVMMIVKGNRTQVVTDACQEHGGSYLGSTGGPAAVLSMNSIRNIECVEYPELGMEAIWKIDVVDFSILILADNKGNDFFKQLKPWTPNCTK